ncbi:MAG: leucine-rich repeat domain-containing protein [Lachnospiraceae bacterium]|nr:leucine-rich repeat domain-containing protein [Lachnospiraceae bacterium]
METNRITNKIALIACFMLLLIIARTNMVYAITSGDWEYGTYPDDGATVASLLKYYGTNTTVTVPSSIDGYQVRELDETFAGNTNVVQVSIPNGVKTLQHTFYQCTNLKNVSIPSSVTKFGITFEESGLETITIPEGTYELDYTFRNCPSLKKVSISGTAKSMDMTFEGCTNLETVVIHTVYTGNGDFSPNTTFIGCKSLKTVTLPEGISYLYQTFSQCSGLKEVHLPSTLKDFDPNTFEGCVALSDIYFAGTECAWKTIMSYYTPSEEDKVVSAKIHIAKTGGHDFTDWGLYTEPDCTNDGEATRICVNCQMEETKVVPKLGHSFGDWVVTKKATSSAAGVKVRTCKECGYEETAEIEKLSAQTETSSGETTKTTQTTTTKTGTKKTFKVKLQKSKVTYNGKAQKPKVTAVTVNGKKIAKKYYTITYKNNKKVGKATVVVKGKGKYKGYKGTVQFKIILQKAKITKVVSSKAGTCTLTWKKDTQAQNFQIQLCQSKSFSSGVKTVWGGKKGKKQIKGLKSKKTYYVRIRAYKKVNGAKWYGKWSAVKTVKIK